MSAARSAPAGRHTCATDDQYVVPESGEVGKGNSELNHIYEDGFSQGEMDCNETHLGEEDLNRKRSRVQEGSSSEEGWQTISRGHKIVRKDTQEIIEKEIQVLATCSNLMPKQFALARLFQQNSIDGIRRVKYVHQYKILITFENITHADRFIQCQAFSELGWTCRKTTEVGISFGIIRDIDLEVTEEDIMKNICCDVELLYAKRLNKRNYNGGAAAGWIQCEAIRLAFRGPALPAYVSIHGMRVNVLPYVFPVTQCSRCWKFGHTRLLCPSKKVVCPKCTKNHENCESTTYRCVNCTGDHMALQKICPVFKKEKKLREIMSEFNCTYRKALTLYVPASPILGMQQSQKQIPIEITRPQKSHMETECAVEEIVQPVQKEKLMSHLFATSEQNAFKPVQNRKLKKQKKRPPTPAPSPACAPQPADSASNKESDGSEDDTHTNDEGPRKTRASYQTSGIGFIKLLSKLYRVTVGNDSLEVKIQKIVKYCTEWILSVIMSGMSVDSLFSIFGNDER